MAMVITQETFDDAVKENMELFSMSPKEAREETINQFEAQGINLANIIKDLELNEETGVPILLEAIEKLKQRDDVIESLQTLKSECNKSVPHRILAAKEQAADIVFEIIEKEENYEVKYFF